MTSETTEAPVTSSVLDIAGLCEKYPSLAEPWPGWACADTGPLGYWHATPLPQFPEGWMTLPGTQGGVPDTPSGGWEGQVAADTLRHEQAHWEIVNGTLPPARSLLDDPPEPPVLHAVSDLEPLPEHGWLTRTIAELGADDELADAAVERFTAVHAEQSDDDWAFEGAEDEPAEEDADEPADDDGEPAADGDPGGDQSPFGGDSDTPDVA
jgi:hypothetical protein